MRDKEVKKEKLGRKLLNVQEEVRKETNILCRAIENTIIKFTNNNGIFVESINIVYDDSLDFGDTVEDGDIKVAIKTDPNPDIY